MFLDGKKVAEKIYKELSVEIKNMEKKPCLGAILVGDEDSPSLRYIHQKKRTAEKIGIDFELTHLPIDTPQETILECIEKYNIDSRISGYIVQLPLPDHIDTQKIIESIAPQKDIDGFHPTNQGKILIGDTSGFVPCTPAGIIQLLESQDISVKGKKVVVIGKSNIVGKPVVNLLINRSATVISCNSQTPDIGVYTKDADILITATGVANMIHADMIGENTIVIDVGFSIIDGKIHGDADTKDIHTQGNLITPVPGGVGPMTVALLMKNTLKAHKICNI